MALEESLLFWKRAFSRKVSEDKFQKEYAYNVRHNYGQEGKRQSYTPYKYPFQFHNLLRRMSCLLIFSCIKIITSNHPSAGDHHGCPFRHFSPDNLRATLSQRGVADKTAQEILDLVRGQHYQIACTRYFEATRGLPEQSEVISHPNEFFERSLKAQKEEPGSDNRQGQSKEE